MKNIINFLSITCVLFSFTSCIKKTKKENSASQIPLIGERIKENTTVRDTINGNISFLLKDSTLVSCTPLRNGYYQIGIVINISIKEYNDNINILKKGKKIIIDGKEAGEVLQDTKVSISSDEDQAWAEMIGYVDAKHIYAETIIENAFIDYTTTLANERELKEMQSFITNFNLDKDDRFSPFVTYANYENWIDDPSPMYRLQLVFKDNHLLGVVHSRPISLSNTTTHQLARNFQATFYNNTKKEDIDEFIKKFNEFVSTAD